MGLTLLTTHLTIGVNDDSLRRPSVDYVFISMMLLLRQLQIDVGFTLIYYSIMKSMAGYHGRVHKT